MRLFLLFVVVPAIELMLLIQIGGIIGTLPTFGIIVATGLAGSALARQQGLSVWRRFNQRMASGQLPGDELIDGLIILVSAALLLTPGVLTDVVGLLGLFPTTRRALRIPIKEHLMSRVSFGSMSSRPGTPNESNRRENGGVSLGGQASDRPSYTHDKNEQSAHTP